MLNHLTHKHLDNIIREWSYNVDNGMPDVSNPIHRIKLKETLNEMGYPKKFAEILLGKLREADESDKYISIGYGKYKLKKDVGPDGKSKPDTPTFEKDDAGKFVKIGGDEPDEKEEPKPKPMKIDADPFVDDKEKETKWKPKNKSEQNKLDSVYNKTSNNLNQVPWDEGDKDKFVLILDKFKANEDLSEEDIELFNKYAKIKDTSKMSNPELAIYMSNSDVGDFRQGRRNKIELGTGVVAMAVRDRLLDQGVETTAATTSAAEVAPPKIGGKTLTIGKMAKGKPIEHTVKKTYSDDDPSVITSVTIGSHVMTRKTEPERDELIKELTELMVGPQRLSGEDAEKKAKLTIKAIRRYNDQMELYADLEKAEFVQLIDGQDVTTPEGRDRLTKEGPIVLADSIKGHLGENPTSAEKEIVGMVESLSDIEDPVEYEKKCLEILDKMNKVNSIRKGAADLTESLVMLSMNKNGIPTEAPHGETVKVVDLVSYPDLSGLDSNNPDYLKKLASGTGYVVTLEKAGGLSVKMDGGAASGAADKIRITKFKNKKTSEMLTKVIDLHNNFMGTAKQPLTSDRIANGKGQLDSIEKWARDNEMIEGELLLPNGRSTRDWAEDTISLWQDKGTLPKDLDLENKQLLLDSLDQYCRAGLILEKVHNSDIDFQPFGNIDANTRTGELEVSDGITSYSHMKFSPNPGFKMKIYKYKDGTTQVVMRPNSVFAGNLIKIIA